MQLWTSRIARTTVRGLATMALLAGNAHAANVPGWPATKIAMGGVINGGNEATLLQQRPVDALFTYAGIGGDGDRERIIPFDQKVDRIVRQMRAMEGNLGGQTFMPTIVFYTVDGSSSTYTMKLDLSDNAGGKYLRNHYINLISMAKQLQAYRDARHPVPATLLLNPDYLGELQKQCEPTYCDVPYDMPVPVAMALNEAFDYLQLDKSQIPAQFRSANTTIAEYNQSISWLVRQFAPNVPFGWHVNVWAGDKRGHGWLQLASRQPTLVPEHAAAVADFMTRMKVYGNTPSPWVPDFIAFDKWERDTFTANLSGLPVNGGYLYNAPVMQVYLDYVKAVAGAVNKPAMLWQIPGGHLQVAGDIDTRGDHASNEADWILGNLAVNSSLSNVQSYIVNAPMPNPLTTANVFYQGGARTVGEHLRCPTVEPACWQSGHLNVLQNANVFAVLWGGGSTTSIAGTASVADDGGWLFNRIRALGLNNGTGSSAPIPPLPPSPGQTTCGAWQADVVYNAGECVTYNGIRYKAQWYTLGDNPSTHSGGAYDGKVWLIVPTATTAAKR